MSHKSEIKAEGDGQGLVLKPGEIKDQERLWEACDGRMSVNVIHHVFHVNSPRHPAAHRAFPGVNFCWSSWDREW